MEWPSAFNASACSGLVFREGGQAALGVFGLGVLVIGRLDVGPQEAGVGDGLAARAEVDTLRRSSETARMRTDTDEPIASVICEATVRRQISS